MSRVDILKGAAHVFGELSSQSKMESFLKGYLMGLGHTDHEVDMSLLAKDPDTFKPIEEDMVRISKEVREKCIVSACILLAELYSEGGRELPGWVKKRLPSG